MPYPAHELFGKTFGIYGFGNIGRATAKIADAFGMNVIVHTRTRPKDCPYTLVDEEQLFRQSDFLSLHCPLNESTHHIVNERTLALMKEKAVIINTARGGLIDEAALAAALNNQKLGAALLDVLTYEPMRRDCPLYGAKNAIFTPHIAWIPQETRQRLVDIVAQNLSAFINGGGQNIIV
jgi:glycerate dehydrogenase